VRKGELISTGVVIRGYDIIYIPLLLSGCRFVFVPGF